MSLCCVRYFGVEQSTAIPRNALSVFSCGHEFRNAESYCTGFRKKHSFRWLIFNGMFQKIFDNEHTVDVHLCPVWGLGRGNGRTAPLVLDVRNREKLVDSFTAPVTLPPQKKLWLTLDKSNWISHLCWWLFTDASGYPLVLLKGQTVFLDFHP
jgi:hypothetical protein